jgi:putative Mn2+ efflux pump MntP
MDEGQAIGIILLVFIGLFMCFVCLSKNNNDDGKNLVKVENLEQV